MKKQLLFAAVALSISGAAAAQIQSTPLPASGNSSAAMGGQSGQYTAEAVPVFRYPEQNNQPRSELRVREISEPGMAAVDAPRPVVDSPDSVAQYQRCQQSANREATTIADMQGRLAGCLRALDERRQAGR